VLPELHRLGGYRACAPPGDLAAVVELLWEYRRPAGAPAIPGRGHRVLPDPGVSLCLSSTDEELVLIGPVRTPRFFAPPEGFVGRAVKLKAEWCRVLLGVDPAEHEGGVDPMTELRRLRDRARRGGLAALLDGLRALRDLRRPSGGARLAHRGLERLRAGAAVAAVARELAVSERHLRRAIVEVTGASPKRQQRAWRLSRTVAAADALPRPDWARLAAEMGYADQAHLIHEHRALTGRSPAELHAERAAQRR
jgi:AraC-like DNA-binding protein